LSIGVFFLILELEVRSLEIKSPEGVFSNMHEFKLSSTLKNVNKIYAVFVQDIEMQIKEALKGFQGRKRKFSRSSRLTFTAHA